MEQKAFGGASSMFYSHLEHLYLNSVDVVSSRLLASLLVNVTLTLTPHKLNIEKQTHWYSFNHFHCFSFTFLPLLSLLVEPFVLQHSLLVISITYGKSL